MPAALQIKKTPSLKSYFELKKRVRETLARGRERVRREIVHTAWETGHLILKHILLTRKRGRYGDQVLLQLSRDIGISTSELRFMVEFARTYSNLVPERNLSWSHYKALLAVNDKTTREKLALKVKRLRWSKRELRAEIRKLKSGRFKKRTGDPWVAPTLLTPRLGKLHTYQLIDPAWVHWPQTNGLLLDQGFKDYRFLESGKVRGFKAGEIVEVAARHASPLLKSDRTDKDLFTYLAYVDRVIDGDTLWTVIGQDLRGVSREKLRLRGIDAPEMNTAAGKRAFEFLKKVLKPAPYLILRSHKNDKYDRYETDLYIPKPGAAAADPSALSRNDLVFINNLLLETGHAVPYRD